MSNGVANTDWKFKLLAGGVDGGAVVHMFGRNDAVGTTFVPICPSGNYRTPKPSAATTLRIKAGGNANDTAAGTGARKVFLQGLDATGALVEEELVTAGISASASTTTAFMRLLKMYVSESGTYATQTAGSHAGAITIQNTAGTEDWGIISATDFPRGQSTIGAYTIPLNKTGYVTRLSVSSDASKSTDVVFFQRTSVLDESAPFDAMRVIDEVQGLAGSTEFNLPIPIGPFPAGTDVGAMGKVSVGTGSIQVDMTIVLFDV